MSVLAISKPIIAARKKTSENAETSETGKTSENHKNNKNRDKDENLGTNLIQILCIQYYINF